jgi:hypothetical protein
MASETATDLLRECLSHLQAYSDQAPMTHALGVRVAEFLGVPFVPSAEYVPPKIECSYCKHCDRPITEQPFGLSKVWVAQNGTMFCKTGAGYMSLINHSPKTAPETTCELVERVAGKELSE